MVDPGTLKISKPKDFRTQKPKKSTPGAPSQYSQSIRKGKRAWRKNIDIQDVEEGLEELREEERLTGAHLHKMQDADLFQIDVKGDAEIRKSLPRFSKSQLTATKILAERSAVPAVFSRSTPANKRRPAVSHEDKSRLLRIAKRQRIGPFNTIVNSTEFPAGGAILELSEAVKSSGTYDPWIVQVEDEELADGMEAVQKKKVKAPALTRLRDVIAVPAIVEPHQGISYNPPADAHQELLLKAHKLEERRLQAADKVAEVKKKMDRARQEEDDPTVPSGMKVAEPGPEDEDDVVEGTTVPTKKFPQRKTKSQRNKALRLLAERRALAEQAAKKRMLATIASAKVLRRSTAQQMSAREKQHAARRSVLQEKLKRHGLTGRRLGKHKVPEGEIDVQLGEELSESLRALRPEGNLFRDRFLSLQQRALVEPRVPVLVKKRRRKTLEFEKHAWKRFE